jgi:hypothetical protein
MRTNLQLFYVTGMFMAMKYKQMMYVTPIAQWVFHYWIVVIASCDEDSIWRLPGLCFTCILMVEFPGQGGKGQENNVPELSTSFIKGRVA